MQIIGEVYSYGDSDRMKQREERETGAAGWKSSLRTKTLLVIVATFIGVYAIIAVIMDRVVSREYLLEETLDTTQKVNQALSALNNDLSDLKNLTAEWSRSDDTYALIQNGNQAFVKTLDDTVFLNNRLNVVLVVNASGVIVFSKAYSFADKKAVPVPQGLMSQVSANSALTRHTSPGSSLTGIVSLSEGPLSVISNSVSTGAGAGPINGTVIVGRFIDSNEISLVGDIARLSVTAYSPADPRMPGDFHTALDRLLAGSTVAVERLGPDSVAGYTLLRNINGQPALVLRVDAPRPLYTQGARTVFYFEMALLGTGLITVLILLILLERLVITPVTDLSQKVSSIGETLDITVPVRGDDEVSHLAKAINGMLERRRQAEERIAHLATFPQMNPNPVVEMSATGKITYMNPEALRRFPDMATALGDHPYLAGWEDAVRKFRTGEAQDLVREVNVGDTWYSQSVSWVQPTRSIRFYGSDITQRKLDEIEKQRIYEEEKQLRLQLEKEISRRIEFTRALVHELKTPLTPILAASELLIDGITADPWLKLSRNIRESALRLNKRVDELLDLARVELGILQLKLAQDDPAIVLQRVTDRMTAVASKKGQSLILTMPPSLPPLKMDHERIDEVLSNLVTNAIKFAPAGAKITVAARVDAGNLITSVHDTGEAIKAEESTRIFEAYRPSLRDKDRLGGLGLGLALCKLLVELHGGKIWLDSEDGAGNTFSFSLPIEEGNPKP